MDLEKVEDLALKLYDQGFNVKINLAPLTLIVRGPIKKHEKPSLIKRIFNWKRRAI